ncbi:MAG: tetratricopeptide repeat protein, partial [Proteobacteria bacterium]|nr:tetratricopeptide repeat protein [Pseudomonadota bacterium]
MLLCNGCASSYDVEEDNVNDTKGMWLVRTTDGKILGPYEYEPLRELIADKKIVFLDEISRSGDDWTLIKNIEFFRDIALKSSYNISEPTRDIDLNKIRTESEPVQVEIITKRQSTRPPIFKHRREPEPGTKNYQQRLMWWKNRKAIFGLVTLTLIGAWAISVYVIKMQNKETDMFKMISGGDTFNKYYIEGREFEEGGLFKEASKYYDKALALKSNHSGAKIRKAAINLVIDGDISSAEKDLEKLYSETNIGKITDQEEQADIKTFLGILEFKKGNNQSAIGYFYQALAVKPTYAYLYYNIGVILFKQGNYTEALEYFKNAQKLLPMFTDAMLYEGRSFMKLNRFREASKVFAEGIVQNPNIRQFYILGAYSAFKVQGADKALDILENIT